MHCFPAKSAKFLWWLQLSWSFLSEKLEERNARGKYDEKCWIRSVAKKRHNNRQEYGAELHLSFISRNIATKITAQNNLHARQKSLKGFSLATNCPECNKDRDEAEKYLRTDVPVVSADVGSGHWESGMLSMMRCTWFEECLLVLRIHSLESICRQLYSNLGNMKRISIIWSTFQTSHLLEFGCPRLVMRLSSQHTQRNRIEITCRI